MSQCSIVRLDDGQVEVNIGDDRFTDGGQEVPPRRRWRTVALTITGVAIAAVVAFTALFLVAAVNAVGPSPDEPASINGPVRDPDTRQPLGPRPSVTKPSIPGVSINTINDGLPPAWGITLDRTARSLSLGSGKDAKLDSEVVVTASLAEEGHPDHVYRMGCQFKRPDLTFDIVSLGEVRSCLAAVLNNQDQAAAATWLKANAADLRQGDRKDTRFATVAVAVFMSGNGIAVQVYAPDASTSPSSGP
jgi:hypothetical protein